MMTHCPIIQFQKFQTPEFTPSCTPWFSMNRITQASAYPQNCLGLVIRGRWSPAPPKVGRARSNHRQRCPHFQFLDRMFQNTSKYHHFSPNSFHQFGGLQNSDSQGTISLSLGQFGVCISGFKQDPHLVPIPTGYLSQGTPRRATVHHWDGGPAAKMLAENSKCAPFSLEMLGIHGSKWENVGPVPFPL